MKGYKQSSIHSDLATLLFWAGIATLLYVWFTRMNPTFWRLLASSFGF